MISKVEYKLITTSWTLGLTSIVYIRTEITPVLRYEKAEAVSEASGTCNRKNVEFEKG